jgi:hypothetical protein
MILNFGKTQFAITGVYAAWLPLALAVAVILFRARPRPAGWPGRFGWPLVPVLILNCLCVFAKVAEPRYFYPALPLLLVASHHLGPIWAGARTRWPIGVMVLSALAPALGRWAILTPPSKTAAHYAWVLSEKLHQAKVNGPFAGNAMLPRGRTGLFLAFLMDEPWVGDEPNPTAQSYRGSDATMIVVRRDAPVNAELEAANDFQNLDPILFANQSAADAFPVRVYQLHRAGPP